MLLIQFFPYTVIFELRVHLGDEHFSPLGNFMGVKNKMLKFVLKVTDHLHEVVLPFDSFLSFQNFLQFLLQTLRDYVLTQIN